jgi:glycosyltransferase involved in cell wall biosynthesis
VLHVIDHLNLGGAQTVVENLLRHADRSLVDPRVLALHGPGSMGPRIERLGVPVSAACAGRRDPRLPLRLLSAIRAANPDIVHAHLVVSCALCEALRPFFPRRTRLVSHVQNIAKRHDQDPYQNWLEHRMYGRSDAVIACGARVAESLRAHTRARPERTITILNGVEDGLLRGRNETIRGNVRADLGAEPDQVVALSASRLAPQKNLFYGIDVMAVAMRREPRLRWWIAGDGPDEKQLRAVAERQGIMGATRFLGFRDDVPRLMQGADLFFMPSRHEGLSLALAEAMGAGLMPVATRFEAVEEILSEDHALLIPMDDARKAGDDLAWLACDRERQAAGSAKSLDRAQREFSASRMTRQVEALYEKLAGTG